jgi:hypothetical protein
MTGLPRHEGHRGPTVRWPLRASLLIVLALGVVAVPAASGHGGTHATGYVSTFSDMEPHEVGVLVNVSGPDDRLRVTNYSPKTVDVLGVQHEPYLRFTGGAVYENTLSPTSYLNASHSVPPTATSDAEPRWKKVAAGASYRWHDHRIVWTGRNPPEIVQEEPDTQHLIFRWNIPATADGEPFAIKGYLGWGPPAHSDDGGTAWWPIALAVGGALAAAALVVGVGARRMRRRAP